MKRITVTIIVASVVSLAWTPLLSFASSLFYVDDAGNVGIGNSTPQHRLDVSGAMYSRLVTASSSAINWNLGNVQSLSLTSSPTLSFSNAQAGGEYKLILRQDATGGRTVTWPASVAWPDGTPPTLTTSAEATDTISFVYDGTYFLGSSKLNYQVPAAINIAFDATSTGSSSGTTLTVSHTTSGSNRSLLVFVAGNNTGNDDVTSVSYNGVSMTRVDAMLSSAGDGRYHYAYFLANPALGTHDIVVTESTAQDGMWLLAASFTGTNQTGSVDAHGTLNNVTASTLSPSLTTTAARAWTVAWGEAGGSGGGDGFTPGTGSTFRVSGFNTNDYLADSDGGLSPGSHALNFVRVTGTTGNDTMIISLAPAN